MAHIDTTVCAKMVTDVASRCAAPTAPPPTTPPQSLDGLATAIAFGSAVIMVVTLVVVGIGIVVAVRWGKNVVQEAKDEAREEVSRVAPQHVRAYLDEKVPGMVADTIDATRGGGTPQEQAEALSGDPR